MRRASGPGVGSTPSTPSMDSPTSTTLLTVPRPGSCRKRNPAQEDDQPGDDDYGPD